MAFRLLSGEAIRCEAELGSLGAEVSVQAAREVLARHLELESRQRVRLVTSKELEDGDVFIMEDSCATVQIMPDPLEANFAEAMGLEHFADALQAGEPFS